MASVARINRETKTHTGRQSNEVLKDVSKRKRKKRGLLKSDNVIWNKMGVKELKVTLLGYERALAEIFHGIMEPEWKEAT